MSFNYAYLIKDEIIHDIPQQETWISVTENLYETQCDKISAKTIFRKEHSVFEFSIMYRIL